MYWSRLREFFIHRSDLREVKADSQSHCTWLGLAGVMFLGFGVAFACLLVLGVNGRAPTPSLEEMIVKSSTNNKDEIDNLVIQLFRGNKSDLKLAETIGKSRTVDFQYANLEETLRYRWLGALVFQLGLMVALTVYSLMLIFRYTHDKSTNGKWSKKRKLCLAAPPVFGVALYCLMWETGQGSPLHVQLLKFMEMETENPSFDRIITFFNAWGGTIGLGVAIALSLMVFRHSSQRILRNKSVAESPANFMASSLVSGSDDVTEIKEMEIDFRRLLFVTMAFLVAVTVQIYCEFSWPSALFDDENLVKLVRSTAASASFAYGAIFTVIAGFMFIPTAIILEADKTMGLKTLAELLAILAPLLTAVPFTGLFG